MILKHRPQKVHKLYRFLSWEEIFYVINAASDASSGSYDFFEALKAAFNEKNSKLF